jgi:2-polyprenyl-6-methoxyphenol hydroxylase-like FAD-dependent oxidoreductase
MSSRSAGWRGGASDHSDEGEPDAHSVLVELVHGDGSIETVHPEMVIGAGGAHSITRDSMGEPLEGATYQGHFLGADIAMQTPFPRAFLMVNFFG